jgi:serine/threonine protein kinase
MAPEVESNTKSYRITEKADIYSAGCVLYHLITGKDISKEKWFLEGKLSFSKNIPI